MTHGKELGSNSTLGSRTFKARAWSRNKLVWSKGLLTKVFRAPLARKMLSKTENLGISLED